MSNNQRGIYAIQEDLTIALAFALRGEDSVTSELAPCCVCSNARLRICKPGIRAAQPAFFAQQIHNRAVVLGLAGIARPAAARLEEIGQVHLKLLWAAENESPELKFNLREHKDTVSSVAITPDGQRAISSSEDRTIKIWDLVGGTMRKTLTGHTGRVHSIRTDGENIYSASEDETLKVWSLETGSELYTLGERQFGFDRLAVAPQFRCVVSLSSGRFIDIWNLDTRASMGQFDFKFNELRDVVVLEGQPQNFLFALGGLVGIRHLPDDSVAEAAPQCNPVGIL